MTKVAAFLRSGPVRQVLGSSSGLRKSINKAVFLLALGLGMCSAAGCGGGWQGERGSIPAISVQPASQTVVVGQPATFNVVAAGTTPITYQWDKGGAPIPGATSSTYSTPATTSADNGTMYTVTVTDPAGSITSAPATLTVSPAPAAPTITAQPVSETVNAGQPATFSVVAAGTALLSYQWDKGGAPIGGATASTYTTPPATSSDNGTMYTVTVTDPAGSITSAPAILTVNSPPAIATQPASQTVALGQPATFSAMATGTGPLMYQWLKGGVPIAGATSSSYTTPATVSGDSGSVYTVIVTNAEGTVTSAPATLTVNTPPAITTQPVSQTVTAGQPATFSAAATGTGPLTYQWSKGGVPIAGATSSSYTTPATASGDSGSMYTVTVTNAAGTVTSMAATLTVNTPAAITTQPVDQTVTVGQPATFSATATGTGPLTYQWAKDGVPIGGATSSTYTTPATVSGDSGSMYTVTVTNAQGAVTSAPAKLTVNTPPAITAQPVNQTVVVGQPATFSATATGTGPLTYQWSKGGVPISGATSSTYTTPATASGDNGSLYTVTVTNAAGTITSAPATLTVNNTPPVITTQPASQNVCTNGSTTLSVTASYATSYQWNLNGSPIPGAMSSTYFIPMAIAMDAGNYSVTVTNPAGSVTSNVAAVVVGTTISTNPVSLSISATQTATFSVSATGLSPFSYQWYVIPPGTSAGVAIAGATSFSYTTPAVTLAFSGGQYYATVTDACTTLTSSNATLTVTSTNVPPTITTQPLGQTISTGGTTTFSVAASGTPGLSYQWYRIPAGGVAGVAVSGATSPSYTVPSTATNTGNDQDKYYAVVTNPYGQAVSQPATLAVGSGVQLQLVDQPKTVYANPGDPATYSVTATSTLPITYQWYRAAPGSSTFTPISGATSSTYTQASTAVSDTGSVFRCVVSNGVNTSVTSATAGLFVGALSSVNDLCDTNWKPLGNAIAQSGCSYQLTAAVRGQQGEIVWPVLISTGNILLSFTITVSNPSSTPADGFAMVLGDPSLGATTSSVGAPGQGLGAKGIAGLVLGFDTFRNGGDPPVPYLGVGRGESALWENPWTNVNTKIPALAMVGASVAHNYTISIVQGQMTVTLDGAQVFSGQVVAPPVAYLYVTGSTGGSYEQTVISNVKATVSTP